MIPSLESLRFFAECVRAGSFAAAAERLCVTPAAVSLRVRTLEKALGASLFVRSGPRIAPTTAALALAERVERGLKEVDLGLAEFHAAPPRIRLTAPPSFAARFLAPRIPRYRALNPGVGIELDVSADPRPNEAFDVAIRTGAGAWPGLEARALFPVDLTPMLSPALASGDDLASLADLMRLPLLPHPDWIRWLAQVGADDQAVRYAAIEYPTHELNAEAAMAGEGVALLPRALFHGLLDEGRLVAPYDQTLVDADWHFAVTRQGEDRLEVRAFLQWLSMSAEGGAITEAARG